MLYTLYRNTVFVCDTGNKAVRMLTSAKGLILLQSKMAHSQYANGFRLDKKAKEEDPPRTFEDHVNSAEELVAFLSNHEQEALESTGKRNNNGPDMTIPQCTILPHSARIADQPHQHAKEIGHQMVTRLLDRICFESYDNFRRGMLFQRNASRP